MPLAFESFSFDEYDAVISVTSESAKGIITKPKTMHLCYCLTPTRYLWSGHKYYFDNRVKRLAFGPIVNYLRKWDLVAAQRPDGYIAISKIVQGRIEKYYGRESQVVYPPLVFDSSMEAESPAREPDDFFLVVSRLVRYKKVDLVVDVFNRLGWKLKVIGGGRELNALARKAKKNIEFLGHLTDEALVSYYQKCQAVIFPQEEDFGLVPLEAQWHGRPVISYRAGGALETVIERKTGLFFKEQTVEALAETLIEFKREDFDQKICRRQAEKFNLESFKKEFKKVFEEQWKNFQV
jgi:glycosyltransferase involved in cell wall biosynthesis